MSFPVRLMAWKKKEHIFYVSILFNYIFGFLFSFCKNIYCFFLFNNTETAFQPLIWHSEGLSSQGFSSPAGAFLSQTPAVRGLTYSTLLYSTLLYYTILILYYAMLCYAILYYTIPYYTILYHTILYYTILYYTIYCRQFAHLLRRTPSSRSATSACPSLSPPPTASRLVLSLYYYH